MPRMRTIKPGFFISEDVSALPLRARLTWIGLWTHCDDEGRAKDNLKLIKAAIWPLDPVSLLEVEEDLQTLAANERIVRYTVDGKGYLAVVNWHDHQHPQKATPSKLPAPPAHTPPPPLRDASPAPPVALPESSDSPPVALPDGYRGEGRVVGGESRGGAGARPPDQRPPRTCPAHAGNPDPPNCGRCADARRAADRWHPATQTPPPLDDVIRTMPPRNPDLAAAGVAAARAALNRPPADVVELHPAQEVPA